MGHEAAGYKHDDDDGKGVPSHIHSQHHRLRQSVNTNCCMMLEGKGYDVEYVMNERSLMVEKAFQGGPRCDETPQKSYVV